MPGSNGLIMTPMGGAPTMNVILNVGVFNVVTGPCQDLCGDCCFFSCPETTMADYTPAIGSTDQATLTVEDCEGGQWDFKSVGGAAQSRHMYGHAADLENQAGTLSEWQAMTAAAGMHAGEAQADFVESRSGPCGIACAHADWRFHSGGYSH